MPSVYDHAASCMYQGRSGLSQPRFRRDGPSMTRRNAFVGTQHGGRNSGLHLTVRIVAADQELTNRLKRLVDAPTLGSAHPLAPLIQSGHTAFSEPGADPACRRRRQALTDRWERCVPSNRRTAYLLATLGLAIWLTACTAMKTWTEDVQLFDGRVIPVQQRRVYQRVVTAFGSDLVPRDCWLIANLPGIPGTVIWHESLLPMVLNFYAGTWYLIAMPPTIVEFRKYGRPRPGYVAFSYSSGSWRRIPLASVPSSLYNVNLLIPHTPPTNITHVTLANKLSANSDPRYPHWTTHVDPNWNTIE